MKTGPLPLRLLPAALSLAALWGLAGCASLPPIDPRVTLAPSARGAVEITYVHCGETPAGIPTVDFALRNRRGGPQTVKIATQWYSQGSATTSVLSEPRPVSLLPHETVDLREVAPNARQDSFRITVLKD